jgi:glycosyltransferase involved in cell wall biosynthesis
MRVTVIIPTYNGAWCFAETLRSVQAQSLSDFEAIVIDDGSTDGTAHLARAQVGDDPRFQLIEQPNAGVAATRNRALSMARGDYVALVDQDDIWRETFLETAVAALDRRPAAVMAFARSVWIDRHGRPADGMAPQAPARVDYRDLLRRNPIGNGSCTVIRREPLQRLGFDAELVARVGQVDDWWTQLQLSWMGEVIMIDEPLVEYRISARATSDKQILRMARGMAEVVRRARRQGPRLPARDYAYARSRHLLGYMRRARASGRWRLALSLAAWAYLSNPLWMLDRELREPWISLLRRPIRRPQSVWTQLLNDEGPPEATVKPPRGARMPL